MARILVVEDNPQNLKLTTVILTAGGHTVVAAPTAVEAEQAVAVQVPDLILMDMALPGKDGYTLTRELRLRPETARLPILAVSSFAMPGDAERALAAGCTAYVTKPIRRAPLLRTIEELLASASVDSRSTTPTSESPEDPSASPTRAAAADSATPDPLPSIPAPASPIPTPAASPAPERP
jgi:two-component system cell cycle response regulator DivK